MGFTKADTSKNIDTVLNNPFCTIFLLYFNIFQYFTTILSIRKATMSQKMIRKLSRGVNIVGGIAKNREKCFFFPFTLILSYK